MQSLIHKRTILIRVQIYLKQIIKRHFQCES